MIESSKQNKKAWEFNAYDFWLKESGQPAEKAQKILANPARSLRFHASYFSSFQGVKVANICGSCGKKAVALAALGADVTVFDISEENKKYAMELAQAAKVPLHYEVCDVLEIDLKKYAGHFDVVYMEGGILHYFHDLSAFMQIMGALLKPEGFMILSDFHPFLKIYDVLDFQQPLRGYFSKEIFEGEMPHARFYDEETRNTFPKCSLRKYTISEIINAVIQSGFILKKFDEHPAWTNPDLPGEFTLIAAPCKTPD
ncbi:MAG: methyltransferase domain-containing protein [Clostridiales bacterium]|nr:methyltransferase domain-containing protein [Clostridiales bacterium]